MTLDIASRKIVAEYLINGTDMNDSIAKYAMENNLNIEQTKRLVEESNKTCYLQKFASTGEQIFDVAQYNIVKEKIGLADKVEKVAAIKFNEFVEFEKVANEEIPTTEYDIAIAKVRSEIGSASVKLYSLEKTANYKGLGEHEYSQEKTNLKNQIEHKEKIINILMEKRAGIISDVAGAILKGGAKTIGGTAKFVAAAPVKRGLMPIGYASTFKQGMNKVKPEEATNFITNKTVEITKEAGIIESTEKIVGESKLLNSPLGAAIGFGLLGLTAAAAKGSGGIVSRMMKERQLNESFNTISQANADIRQIPNARAYFDVIARHSPDLANDPMVAPQLIRQFDTFGGVDVNTVGKLREIDAMGRKDRPRGSSGFETASNLLGGVKSFGDFKSTLQSPSDYSYSNDHLNLINKPFKK
jgi:hypothetical protein